MYVCMYRLVQALLYFCRLSFTDVFILSCVLIYLCQVRHLFGECARPAVLRFLLVEIDLCIQWLRWWQTIVRYLRDALLLLAASIVQIWKKTGAVAHRSPWLTVDEPFSCTATPLSFALISPSSQRPRVPHSSRRPLIVLCSSFPTLTLGRNSSRWMLRYLLHVIWASSIPPT